MQQLQIEVPDSPGAKARFTAEDELLAYAENAGFDAAQRQKRLAVEAGLCGCGAQERFDAERKKEDKRPKPVLGYMHLPGCPAFSPMAKKTLKISEEEQVKLYQSNDLRGRLRLARERGSL